MLLNLNDMNRSGIFDSSLSVRHESKLFVNTLISEWMTERLSNIVHLLSIDMTEALETELCEMSSILSALQLQILLENRKMKIHSDVSDNFASQCLLGKQQTLSIIHVEL
jgi:hypothetical protein